MHLPVFILFAPVVGCWLGGGKVWRWVFLLLAAVSAVFFLLANQTRPLVGPNRLMTLEREVYYFMKKPKSVHAYAVAAAVIRSSGCTDVGLVQDADSWEYPLWALTGFGQVRFRAVAKGGSFFEQAPCLLVTLDVPQNSAIRVGDSVFAKVWEEEPLQILERLK